MSDARAAQPGLTILPARGATRALVVLAHGGRSRDTRADHHLRPPGLRMLPFTLDLSRHGRRMGLATAQLRYRVVGYNDGDPVADLWWALDRLAERYGVPVCLVGHSMGARAAVQAAGHPTVVSVAALATWIEPRDTVENVEGKTFMLVHGLRDRVTDPARAYGLGEDLRRAGARACAFEIGGSGHTMLDRSGAWHTLTREFALGTLGLAPLSDRIEGALAAAPEQGLRVLV